MEFNDVIEKLENERLYAEENFVPIIRKESAKFLYDFVKSNKCKIVLEIGTAIGYSGSIILSAGAEKLVTVDINEKSLDVAKKTFDKLSFRDKITIYQQDAKIVLKDLVDSNNKFDMIFLDGAKGQYINYLPNIKKLLNKGGFIFADNVLLQGMVESDEKIPHRKRTMVVNLRRYLDAIQSTEFDSRIIRIEDGIAISKFKGE